jgi:hypothetical protein
MCLIYQRTDTYKTNYYPQKQIETVDNALVVKDDIEIGSGNVIPLWLFGFLY